MGLEIAWESSKDWVGYCCTRKKKKILHSRSLSREQEGLAQREVGYSAKKNKQILHGERPAIGRRTKRNCTERGQLLGREVVGMGWAVVGWRRRPYTGKKQTENSRDFAPELWRSGKEEERWEKKETCGITTWHVRECILLSSWHATY
ncbi:hypothetical protein SLEP1_g39971 [Rubroshorea leprosula]|uniref:Uncharacterized protein n=1 Tax=Rubroshorea leprosula TaxID=152421 RepID=A0AAV5L1Z5_9ROSI|nr:hypothetical protein SLEP1_g39971 [Rubroshorea leprosula]